MYDMNVGACACVHVFMRVHPCTVRYLRVHACVCAYCAAVHRTAYIVPGQVRAMNWTMNTVL